MLHFTGIAPGTPVLEIGGGDNPQPITTCNVDIRPGPKVHFDFNFENFPWPITTEEFPFVISVFCLEHLSWRLIPQAIAEIYRVLKPGGKTVIVLPNTETQMRYIQDHPEGWEDRDIFTCASITLYGDQNYNHNHHCSFFSPAIAQSLFAKAGFENIVTTPYGAIDTDMVVEASKPLTQKSESIVIQTPASVDPPYKEAMEKSTQAIADCKTTMDRITTAIAEKEKIFEGWDYPVHEVVFRKILERKPTPVLELGAGRGYIGKRLEDAGIPYIGYDKSKQLWMTRVATNVGIHDITQSPWMPSYRGTIDDSDIFCFSMSVLDIFASHPEKFTHIISEMQRTCKRGLHGIDMGKSPAPLDWYKQNLPQGHEVFSTDELQSGGYPEEYLVGDGLTKLNVGSFTTQIHRGWTNLDIADVSPFANAYQYKFKQCDVRQGMPFGTGTVDLIVSSHHFEHLSYKEGASWLKECRRVIRPDGAMRLIMPDARRIMSAYAVDQGFGDRGGNDFDQSHEFHPLSDFDLINEGCRQQKTAAGKLWAMLHEGHSACYDENALAQALSESGWVPHPASFRQTQCGERSKQIIREASDMLPCLSLCYAPLVKPRDCDRTCTVLNNPQEEYINNVHSDAEASDSRGYCSLLRRSFDG